MNNRPVPTTARRAGHALAVLIGLGVASAAFAQGIASDKGTSGATATTAYIPDPIATTSLALNGKLFFTDAKRAQLDKARKDGVQIFNEEVVYRTTVLNGFVKRSDGSTTYWINGGRQGDTRYVDAQDGNVIPSSTMIGSEPKFYLRGVKAAVSKEPGQGDVAETKNSPAKISLEKRTGRQQSKYREAK